MKSQISYPYSFAFSKDYLSITDGNGDPVAGLGPYCGSENPPNYTSESNVSGVYFRSDGTVTGKGFDIEYTCENESEGKIMTKACLSLFPCSIEHSARAYLNTIFDGLS